METFILEYVSSHVSGDIKENFERTGVDHSFYLGGILEQYLMVPSDEDAIMSVGLSVLGFERRLEKLLGKKPDFLDTVKCGLAIHQAWKNEDKDGLKKVREYAAKLKGRR